MPSDPRLLLGRHRVAGEGRRRHHLVPAVLPREVVGRGVYRTSERGFFWKASYIHRF